MNVFLFLISTLPIIIIATIIYKKDKHKEPPLLLIGLFIAGIASCYPVKIINKLLTNISPIFSETPQNLNQYQLAIFILIGISLAEEISKWFTTYTLSYYNKNFDELYDILLYSILISLGFAYLENLFYVFDYGIITGITRAFITIPLHTFTGTIMGHYLGLVKINKEKCKKTKNIILSILIPTLIHGTFDYCLYSKKIILIPVLIFIIIYAYNYIIKQIKTTSNKNIKIK